MAVVLRTHRLPRSDRFCWLCRGRYEIILFHEGLGPKPGWWDKSAAAFFRTP